MGGLPSSYLNLLKLPWLKSFLLSKPLNFKSLFIIVSFLMFQSTHPCGVRPICSLSLSLSTGFNPRTRVGCDKMVLENPSYYKVSIHAPVWGATTPLWFRQPCWLFQSTHPCGVRPNLSTGVLKVKIVSIHAPVWGATDIAGLFYLRRLVSIHAPVWGATLATFNSADAACFNPRTRVGCD